MKNKFIAFVFFLFTVITGFFVGYFSVNKFIHRDRNPSVLDYSVKESPGDEIKGNIEETEQKEKSENPEEKPVIKKIRDTSDCPSPNKEYEDETYMNVDQDTSLGDKSYIPSDLVELPKNLSKYENLCVKEEVLDALEVMTAEAGKEDLKIIVSSGFRDFDTQKIILDTNIKSGNKNATKLVAKPGYSEHQLGVAIDITSPSIDNVSATSRFGTTKESKWLEENSYKYGFIQSYPKGKEDITGYLYEPWHYRYVGTDRALLIHDAGSTINEFLEEEQNKTTQ